MTTPNAAKLTLGTQYILPDEPCAGLSEVNLQSPGSRGFHRYQILYVVRNDRLAEYRTDLGKASKWKSTDQFRIPGGVPRPDGSYEIVETVARLQDIALALRCEPISKEVEITQTDLIQGYYDQLEASKLAATGQKSFQMKGS